MSSPAVTRPSALVSVVRTYASLFPCATPETKRYTRSLPHPEKLGIVIRASPLALVESSAKILTPWSFTLRLVPLSGLYVTQTDSGGTPTRALQKASS